MRLMAAALALACCLVAATLAADSTSAPRVELASVAGPVAVERLAGELQILAVGYTHCPDVCPTTLAVMARMLEKLGTDAQRVTAVFVSLDYVRDSARQVDEYARFFSPRILGLSGDKAQIERLLAVYPVHMEIAGDSQSANFLIDHSSHFLVLRRGEVRAILPFGLSPDVMAALVRDQLEDEVATGDR